MRIVTLTILIACLAIMGLTRLGQAGSAQAEMVSRDEALAAGEIDPERELAREVARRLGGRVAPRERELARVYNALLRAGHDEDAVRRALEPHLERSRHDGD